MSNRDGNQEIYAMDANGSNLRRITRHPSIDATPTWSPAGNQIAFTSDRSGSPQIYIVDAEGLDQPRRITSNESWADRATWSPAPFNEIAYAARSGPGFDIKIYDVRRGDDAHPHQRRRVEREPGVLADRPPHRLCLHIAWATSRSSSSARDGNGLHQVTRKATTTRPNWSR
jgi:TolB protein